MVLMVCDICYSSLNKRLRHSCELNLLKKTNGDQLHGLRATHFRFLQPDFFIARNGNDHASTKEILTIIFMNMRILEKLVLKQTKVVQLVPPIFPPTTTDLI